MYVEKSNTKERELIDGTKEILQKNHQCKELKTDQFEIQKKKNCRDERRTFQ